MDVRYNNILESTRQYFQGVPVNNAGNKLEPEENVSHQKDQRIGGRKHADYLGTVPPSTSRSYWMPQNDQPKSNESLLRQFPPSTVTEAETRQQQQNNLLPPIAALSSGGISNFPPFKSVNKMAHWGQMHPKSSTVMTNHAPPSAAAVSIPYYPLSSQVSVSSSSAFYYPANVQAATAKSAHYYHPPNDIPVNRSRTAHFPSNRDLSVLPAKTSSYIIDSNQEPKTSFSSSSSSILKSPSSASIVKSSSSNSLFLPSPGFKLPNPSSKPYLSPNESLHLMHTSSNNAKTSMGVSSYSSNQNIYMHTASQVNYQTETSKRASSSRHPSLKLNQMEPSSAAAGSASASAPVSALGYSVPKMQPTGFHQRTTPRENSSLFGHFSTPTSMSYGLHSNSSKLPSFPETTLHPVANEKKSTLIPVHYPNVSPALSERTKTAQQLPSNNVELDRDRWAPKNSLRLKRESPLDLSVKTVRQSADSTAKDEENNSYSLPSFQTLDCRIRPQISEPYTPVNVPGFGYSLNRAQPSASATSAPISDFPKTNLNSIFNISAHLQSHRPAVTSDHEKNYWRTHDSDRGVPQQRANLGSGSEFLQNGQRSQQSESIIKQPELQHYHEQRHSSSQHLETNHQSRSSSSQNQSARQPQFPHNANIVQNSVNNLTGANMLPYSKSIHPNATPLNPNDSQLGKKRPLPVDLGYETKAKSPKVDAWLKTIDQQIEEKFSSYVTSRAIDQSSSAPNASLLDSRIQPIVDKNSENFSRNNTEMRHLPFCEENIFHDVKVPESSGVYSKPNAAFINIRESYPVPISGDHVIQQSVVRNYEPSNDHSFKPKCNAALKEEKSGFRISNEKLNCSAGSKPLALDSTFSFKGREDQEKAMPRPRTKAELKQVESNGDFSKPEFNTSNDNPSASSSKTVIACSKTPLRREDVESAESKSAEGAPTPLSVLSISPPKLTEEELENLPRKKLPSEMDESEDGQNASDACVFDFRESDSECEMPVLERQTLHEMRRERDRRVHSKIAASNENLSSEKNEIEEPSSPLAETKDPLWMEPFDSFLEQLTTTPVQKIKKASKKRLKNNSELIENVTTNKHPENIKKSLDSKNEDSNSNKVKDEILLRDNAGIPKVVVKDFKKEEKRRFPNLKLEKLSTSELKQEIAELTSMKKELQEKLLESSSASEKTEPLDELKPNCLHLKKLKSKQKCVKSKDVGNEENVKRLVNLKARKQRRLKRFSSSEAEQTTSSPKIEVRDTVSVSSRISDTSGSKLDVASCTKEKKVESNSLNRKFTLKESKLKNCPKLVLKKINRKDSSESVLSSESDDTKKKNKSISSRLDAEPSVKLPSIDERTKRKMMKRRRASSSIGGRPGLRSATGLRSTKSILNVKRQKQLKNKKRKLSTKSKQAEMAKSQVDVSEKEPSDSVPEAIHLNKKKFKFKSVRRKFRSSGFDYLRKKKKQMKKSSDCSETKLKKFPAIRAKPENINELQVEIKGWVVNKGLGESILHRAARLGYPDAVVYCLEVLEIGASIRDNAGYTPLHVASHRGHLAIARMLLMYGADSSASAIGGIRPLHEAAENGHLELVRLLLSYGADPLLATYSGQTPISLAHDVAMKNLLEHHLADVQGTSAPKWDLTSLPLDFDDTMSGCDILSDPPDVAPCNDLDVEIEYSENILPSTFWLIGEPMSDVWALWQEVASILKLKSTDALVKLLGKTNSEMLRELTPSEFSSKASNPSIFGAANFKFLSKCQKIVLVKYTEQLRSFMNIQKLTISSR